MHRHIVFHVVGAFRPLVLLCSSHLFPQQVDAQPFSVASFSVPVRSSSSRRASSMSSTNAAAQDDLKTLETKVVILGHTGVGKTSMVNQYVRGQFTGNTTATIGAAFMKKIINIDNYSVILQIWDTAGQERFRSMAPMYYRGSHAAILVFDVSDANTLDKVAGWVDELQSHTNEDSIIVLAANKCDLADAEVAATLERSVAYSRSIGATLFETSAKTGKGISELFDFVASTLVKREQAKQRKYDASTNSSSSSSASSDSDRARSRTNTSGAPPNVKLNSANAKPNGGGCC